MITTSAPCQGAEIYSYSGNAHRGSWAVLPVYMHKRRQGHCTDVFQLKLHEVFLAHILMQA